MTTPLLPVPIFRAFDSAGVPLAGGLLYTYAANTLTPKNTYSSADFSTPNSNPVVLDSTGSAIVRLIGSDAYKFVLKDSAGTTQWTIDYYSSSYLTGAEIAALLTGALLWPLIYPITPNETAAGVTPTNYAYQAIDVRRYGYSADNNTATAGANTTALNNAILVASATVSGATGAEVILPTGIGYINAEIALKNRVTIRGQTCFGSLVKAHSTFTTTHSCMFYAENSGSSMFDSILKDLTIDCSNVASLSAMVAVAWQENSGPRSVSVLNCRGYALDITGGDGGASTLELKQCQFFGSPTNTPSGIIRANSSGSSNMLVHLIDSVVAPDPSFPVAKGIEMILGHLHLDTVHFESCTDGVYLDGSTSCTAKNVTGDSGCTNVFHIKSTFTGTVSLDNCKRAGATILVLNDITAESIGSPDPSDYAYPGGYSGVTAKAWCIFNGTTAGTNAPTAGFNVTSVKRNAAGDYQVNLTRPTASVNCAPMASSNLATSGTSITTVLVNTARIDIGLYVAAVRTDANEVKFVLFGY